MDAYAIIKIVAYSLLAFLVLGLFPVWYQHRKDTKASAVLNTVAPSEPFGRITMDDEKVIYHRPDQTQDEVMWNDLTEVGILTTDEGPVLEDVYFMLVGSSRGKGCAIAQGAIGIEPLLAKLQSLPGFDNEALIKAMGCTSNNRFVCWKKK